MHLGAPYLHAAVSPTCSPACAGTFRHVRPLTAYVPLYGSWWMMAVASDTTDPGMLPASRIARRMAERGIHNLRHYDAALHQAIFALPAQWRELFV